MEYAAREAENRDWVPMKVMDKEDVRGRDMVTLCLWFPIPRIGKHYMF